MRPDVVILGAGAAGCVLASRLSEDPSRTVHLIEAGPDYASTEALPDDIRLAYSSAHGIVARSHDWGYSAKMASQSEPVLRGRIVGGSSAVNAQIYLWGLPYDFDRWAVLGNDEWDWSSVEPWFRKVETDQDFSDGHGTDGPIPVVRYTREEWNELQTSFYNACIDAGFPDCPDLNRPYATGVGPYPMNNPGGIRVSAAVAYLNPIRHRPNLTISPDTLTRRIRMTNGRATGLEIERNGNTSVMDAGEVIVASGAIGTPALLQHSGIGPHEILKAAGVEPCVDLPGVGRGLRDHPAVPMYWQTNAVGPEHTHWHQVGLRYTASKLTELTEVATPDDMILYVAHLRDEPKLLMRPTVNLARSVGHLNITSDDPTIQPEIDYALFKDTCDRERMREAIRLCRKLTRHEDFSAHIVEAVQPTKADLSSDDALDAWILQNATTGHHVSGTCKMGSESDPASVVDQRGFVHGTLGLRVVDASIMPDCVRANIHATVLMIAEKIAAAI
jgi:choline dehydrogenase